MLGVGNFLVLRCYLRIKGVQKEFNLFAARTAAGSAIRTVLDQGLQRVEVMKP